MRLFAVSADGFDGSFCEPALVCRNRTKDMKILERKCGDIEPDAIATKRQSRRSSFERFEGRSERDRRCRIDRPAELDEEAEGKCTREGSEAKARGRPVNDGSSECAREGVRC